MKTGVQTRDHANAARGGLKIQRHARAHRRLDPRLDLVELFAARVALQPGQGEWPTTGTRQCLHQVELSIEIGGPLQEVVVTHHLHHTVVQALKRTCQASQLLGAGIGSRRILSLRCAVVVAASGAQACCSGFERFTQ